MPMTEYIEKLLNTRFDEAECRLVEQDAQVVHFVNGQTILREGDYSKHFYFMVSGIIRGYYIDEQGNDITKCFCAEKGVFATECMRTKLPSSFTIESLGNSKCVKFSYDLVIGIMEKNIEVRDKINKLFQKEIAKLEFRIKDLVMLNAEERYNHFCEVYPELHNRVPLKYIASYIGVRVPSLSRIRKNRK